MMRMAEGINTRPKARIFIDGAELGWAPVLRNRVAAGTHSVLLVKDTTPAFRDSFTVHVGQGQELVCIYGRRKIKSGAK